jgi:hypothetical protein
MSGPQFFAFVWGVLAVGVAYVFVRYPDRMEAIYRRNMDRTRTTKRLRERFAPSAAVIIWYRVGGFLFGLVGIGVAAAAATGALR